MWNLQPLPPRPHPGDANDNNDEMPTPTPAPQRKRYRPSKRDIGDYAFTDKQVHQLVDFLKENCCLYDKREKEWCMPKRKEQLWKQATQTFLGSTWLQVRKYYDAHRSDYVKMHKLVESSDAAAP